MNESEQMPIDGPVANAINSLAKIQQNTTLLNQIENLISQQFPNHKQITDLDAWDIAVLGILLQVSNINATILLQSVVNNQASNAQVNSVLNTQLFKLKPSTTTLQRVLDVFTPDLIATINQYAINAHLPPPIPQENQFFGVFDQAISLTDYMQVASNQPFSCA